MKQIKSIIVSCFAIICVALFGSVFTSCNNDDDLLLAGDSQTEQVSPLVQDSVKAVTRSNTPYGAIFVLENGDSQTDTVYHSAGQSTYYVIENYDYSQADVKYEIQAKEVSSGNYVQVYSSTFDVSPGQTGSVNLYSILNSSNYNCSAGIKVKVTNNTWKPWTAKAYGTSYWLGEFD
ncbi:hypothetical protein IJS64_03895 [bacterium]|nr:hypothetical protein [bacterium]